MVVLVDVVSVVEDIVSVVEDAPMMVSVVAKKPLAVYLQLNAS